MSQFKLGAYVTFTHTLRRQWKPGRTGYYNGSMKVWEPHPVNRQGGFKFGIVMGVRTLANGELHYMGDDSTEFIPKEHFQAVLIAWDLRRKPALVPMDAVRLAEMAP